MMLVPAPASATSSSSVAAPLAPAKDLLPALTGVRFLAAFQVVVFHLINTTHPPAFASLPTALKGLLTAAQVPVLLFFALSGFILTYRYGSDHIDVKTYAIARFARIYPIYLVSLVVAAPTYFRFWPNSVGYKLVSGFFCLLLVQDWIPGREWAWNIVLWSLSVEAFLYMVFPILRRLVVRQERRALALLLIGCVLLRGALAAATLFLPSLKAALYITNSPLGYVPVFLAGMCVGRWYDCDVRGARRGPHPVVTLACVAVVIGIAALAGSYEQPYAVKHYALPALTLPFLYVFILALAHRRDPLSRFLARGVFVRLGDASYSLYVLHKPILHLLLWAAMLLAGWNDLQHPLPVLITIAYFVATVVISIFTYEAIEQPARRRITAALMRSRGTR